MSSNDAGGLFFNEYYTDSDDRYNRERQMQDLIDNLLCGTAIYEYTDGHIVFGYLNHKPCEIVGRSGVEIQPTDSITSVHPADRQLLSEEFERAMSTNHSMECVIHILRMNGDYIPVYLLGHIIPDECGKCTVYWRL